MDQKLIFPGLDNAERRASILCSIKSIPYPIPSLRTFFENQKYLEPCCFILRKLLDESEKDRSLWRAFSAYYFEPKEFCMQCTERTSRRLRISSEGQKKLGYVQLWMFCLRHFPEMTSITPKMTPGSGKVRREHNPALWRILGKLAVDLGFRTPEALKLAGQDPDIEHALHFLDIARPDWDGDRKPYISRVAQVLDDMKEPASAPTRPVFTSKEPLSRDRRCGKPHDDDHDSDKSALFVSLFYEKTESGYDITSLCVKRDLFKAFLKSHISEVLIQ